MNRFLIGLAASILVAALPHVAAAQTTGVGYTFGAPGVAAGDGDSVATLHAGGGGEVRIGDRVGIGADIGYLAPFQYFSDGLGVLSVNGTFYARSAAGRRAQPFVTGGYSLLFRDGHANLWNVGGGVDYWMSNRVGLLFEVRDHIWTQTGCSCGTAHFIGPRIGVVWRGR